jgi:hypothetical protein
MTCITPFVLRMSQSVIVASFTWKIDQILFKVYNIKFSRRISGPKEEGAARRGLLHNEELHNLYFLTKEY